MPPAQPHLMPPRRRGGAVGGASLCRRAFGAALLAMVAAPRAFAQRRLADEVFLSLEEAEAPPTPRLRFRLSDEAVMDAFLQATLGEGDRAAAHFHPWMGPVRPLVLGSVNAGERLLLGGLLDWLRHATGVAVELPGAEQATLGVLFSDRPAEDLAGHFWDKAGAAFFPTPDALRAGLPDGAGCFFVRGQGAGKGLLAVPGGVPLEALPCLSRMLLGLMGLRHPLPADLPSVLSSAAIAVEPTPLDRLLVALCVDPALRPGMAEADLRAVLPPLIARHRMWHGFDPLADQADLSADMGDGDVFAPSAERALRAFAAAAVPGDDARGGLVRWPAGAEVPVRLLGRITAPMQAQLMWMLDWVAAATGLKLRAARHPREDGLTLAFAPTLERLWDEHGPSVASFFANDRGRFDAAIAMPGVAAEGALTLMHHTVPTGTLVRTLSLVATDGSPAATLRRLSREMLRALGLRGAGFEIGHSLFDARILAFQPSALDERVLRLAYAEAMRPGMAPASAKDHAARLLRGPSGTNSSQPLYDPGEQK